MKRLGDALGRLALLLGPGGRRSAVVYLALVLVGAVVDTAAIALMLQFLRILAEPEFVFDGRVGAWVESIAGTRQGTDLLAPAAVTLIVVYLLKNAYLAFANYVNYRIVYATMQQLNVRLVRGYLNAPWSFHAGRSSSESLRTVTVQSRQSVSETLLPLLGLARESLLVGAITLWLLWLDPVATAATMLLLGALGGGYLLAISRTSRRLARVQVRSSGLALRWLQESLFGFRETRVRGVEDYFIAGYREAEGTFNRATRLNRVLRESPRFLIETLGVGAMMMIVVLVSSRAASPAQVLPTVGVFAVAAVRMLPSINHLVTLSSSVMQNWRALTVVTDELRALEGRGHGGHEDESGDRLPLTDALRFDTVTFRYDGAPDDAIRDVSLTIRRGERVAFVGPSGAGKSTLFDLLLALRAPTSGRILVDGVPIHSRPRAWQRSVGLIPQSIFLLDASIRENVAYGLDAGAIDEARVWEALEVAQLDAFVRALPDGLETRVGEQGLRISGGQRQRLGIARALYHRPAVLIMDEATAAVDNETEQEITEALRRLDGDTTMLIIAHRLSTVMHCDRLYMVEDGRISGEGSWDELRASHAGFRRMVELQEAGAAGRGSA